MTIKKLRHTQNKNSLKRIHDNNSYVIGRYVYTHTNFKIEDLEEYLKYYNKIYSPKVQEYLEYYNSNLIKRIK